jgi:capsular exopolysaccharide synthesis family protein
VQGLSAPNRTDQSTISAYDLRSYLKALRRRWHISLGAVALSVAVAALWLYRQPRIYQAACTVVIDQQAPQVLNEVREVIDLSGGNYWSAREFHETQFRVIRSKEIAEHVVERLGFSHDKDFPIPGSTKPSKDAVSDLISLTKVVPVKDSRIASIVVEDRSPERAALIANTIAEEYIERNIEFRQEGSRSAAVWLGDHVVSLREQLRRSELALYEYRSSKQLLDVTLDNKQGMTLTNLQSYNEKLADIRAKRMEMEASRKLILAAKGDIEEQETLPEVRQNLILQQLRLSYIELTKKLADLQTRYGEKHPSVDSLRRQVQEIQRDYSGELEKILKSHSKAYDAILEHEKALVRLISGEKQEAIELAKIEVEYKPLSREAEENKRLYDLVIQRQKETALTGLIKHSNVRILDRAAPIAAPVRPRKLFTLFLSAMAGALLGVAISLVLDVLDNTLKSQEETERLLGVPVLGLIPIIATGEQTAAKREKDGGKQRDRDLGVIGDPHSSAAEACRSIRTNLTFLSPERPLRSLLITSPGPREGKTTTAINLAASMAQAGGKVLLIDTDMRRPRIHKALGLTNDAGISNMIVGERQAEDLIKTTSVPGLFVLPAGPTPPNPAELLHTNRFAELIGELCGRFDRVILDSPPTSAVTDPAIISNLVDGALLVVRAGATTREAAYFARRQLDDAKAKILGVIVNCIDYRDKSHGYNYRYYRSYQYGYSASPSDAA